MKGKGSLYVAVFIALLPVLLLRDFTPANELRYLSLADESLRDGTWVTFANQGMPYADKPPLYFWIVRLGRWMFGSHVLFFLSLFSLVPAFVIVYTMDRWAGPRMDAQAASTGKESERATSRWVLLSCGLFLGLAVFLRMDMLMSMFIVLALHTFYRMLKKEGNRRLNQLLFPVYLFLGVFAKGPMGVLIPLASTLAFLGYTGRIRSVGAYWGGKTWGILLAGCLLWWGWVYLEGGEAYLRNLLFHQTMDRAVDSFHHKEPFYYYFLAAGYSVFPWSFLLIGVTGEVLARRRKGSELQQFFFIVFLSAFGLLSCISSKLAVYLLPAFPFWVYGVMLRLSELTWNRWLALTVAFPAVAYGTALPVLEWLGRQEATRWLDHPLFYAAASLLALAGIGSFYLLYRCRQPGRAMRLLAIGLFGAVFVGGWGMPQLNPQIGYGALCRKAKTVGAANGLTDYYVWRLSRAENMDVYLGKAIRKTTPEEWISGRLKGVVLMVPAKEWERVKGNLAEKERYRVGPYYIIIL